jgi:hypothetical protein
MSITTGTANLAAHDVNITSYELDSVTSLARSLSLVSPSRQVRQVRIQIMNTMSAAASNADDIRYVLTYISIQSPVLYIYAVYIQYVGRAVA